MTIRNIKRRRFLQTVVGGLAMSALQPAIALAGDAPDRGFCFMLGNHWSYIGIGWQLGIESCALSILDSLNVADENPHSRRASIWTHGPTNFWRRSIHFYANG
jgi:hypothetical protein